MKMLKTSTIALALLLLMLPAASAQAPQWQTDLKTLTVTAYIDGRDFLCINPTTLYWHHLDYAAVGRLNGQNLPTVLSLRHSKQYGQEVTWTPDWPCPPDNYECRGLQVDSSLLMMGLTLPHKYQLKDFKVIRARGSATLYQAPGEENNYVTMIDFNDDPEGGADWYQVKLTFARLK